MHEKTDEIEKAYPSAVWEKQFHVACAKDPPQVLVASFNRTIVPEPEAAIKCSLS